MRKPNNASAFIDMEMTETTYSLKSGVRGLLLLQVVGRVKYYIYVTICLNSDLNELLPLADDERLLWFGSAAPVWGAHPRG